MLNGFLRKIFEKDTKSKDVAKQRLKFALIYDKIDTSDDILQNLHRDIVEVVSKYFEIDKAALKLDIKKSDQLSALVVNTPILSARHQKKSMAPRQRKTACH